ncbi:MAG: GTPase [Robiginitalea sp.]|uniref:GTPase n=1 Tax=Robiginitalea sp. TaxID=1902411 RepID=UPI003C758528
MQKSKSKNKEYPEGSLVFVWNADAGMLNAVRDSLHKWISPETYSCRLCELTHGFSSAKRAWKNFLEDFERPAYFYYRDTLQNSGIPISLPAKYPLVLELYKGQWHALLKAENFEEITTLEELIGTLKTKISDRGSDSEI